MALIILGLGQKNVHIICTLVSIAISDVNLCFTRLYDYHKPSALFFMDILSAVNMTNVSLSRFTLLLESSVTNKKNGVGQKNLDFKEELV